MQCLIVIDWNFMHFVVMYISLLIMHTGVGTETCGGSEKNRLHGGTWLPDGGPAFIPVSNEADFHVVQQLTQRVTHQSNDERRCVNDFYL